MNNMPHVLIVCDHLGGGGAERATMRLAASLLAAGTQVSIAPLAPPMAQAIPAGAALEPTGRLLCGWGTVIPRPKTSPQKDVWKVLQPESKDLILLSWAKAHLLAPMLPAEKTWLWVHGDCWSRPFSSLYRFGELGRRFNDMRRDRLFIPMTRPVYAGKNMVFVSDTAEQTFLGRFGNICGVRKVIPNPIDTDELKGLAKSGLPAAFDRPFVLFAGRLSPDKWPDHALRAFASSRITDDFVFLGSGPLEQDLRALAARIGISARVHFAGWQANPYPWLRAAKALVLSSPLEGFSLALIEALALGTPVAAYDCCATIQKHLVGDAACGIAPVGDAEALGRSLAAVVKIPSLRQAVAFPEYAPSAVARQFLDLVSGTRR